MIKKWKTILVAAPLAVLAITCVGSGTKGVGNALMDVGAYLSDVGQLAAPDAVAQPGGAGACLRWEVALWRPLKNDEVDSCGDWGSSNHAHVDQDGLLPACPAPDGWEPIGSPSSNTVFVRRCISQ